jgi:hypothetical protein
MDWFRSIVESVQSGSTIAQRSEFTDIPIVTTAPLSFFIPTGWSAGDGIFLPLFTVDGFRRFEGKHSARTIASGCKSGWPEHPHLPW